MRFCKDRTVKIIKGAKIRKSNIEWITYSMLLGLETIILSIEEDGRSVKCVGSVIICCRLYFHKYC